MVAAELAPDGQTVALPMAANATSRVRLIALDVKTAKFTSLAGFEDADIADFHWVNAHRLVFGVRDRDAPVGDVDTVSGLQTRRRPVT